MLLKVTFVHIEYLWLLLVIPFLVFWVFTSINQQKASITLSDTQGLESFKTFKNRIKHLPYILRILGIGLCIIALAQPRFVDTQVITKKTEGIDIVMAIDISGSMLAKDLKPNRLEALKQVASKFARDRVNDRIGVVVYAGESYTKVPSTTDKIMVIRSIQDLGYSQDLEQGTAIGMGLLNAVNRLKDSDAKSKIVILLTDGVNNTGFANPKIAYALAAELNIKVYTIGIGTSGKALSPVGILPNGQIQFAKVPVEIDEDLLKEIAAATGGRYYRAHNNRKLETIYDEINRLEKTEIEQVRHYSYKELFRHFILAGLLSVVLGFLLEKTIFRGII